jgi:hypothetical protein
MNIISMYPAICDVLISFGEDITQKSDWPKIRAMVLLFESFDFVFSAHLMVTIIGYTNDLSLCLQIREQDILNTLSLVSVAFKGSPYFATNMASKFCLWMVIMCILEDHLGFLQSK